MASCISNPNSLTYQKLSMQMGISDWRIANGEPPRWLSEAEASASVKPADYESRIAANNYANNAN